MTNHKEVLKRMIKEGKDPLVFDFDISVGEEQALSYALKIIKEFDRMSKSIISLSIKGTKKKKFRSVPEMQVAFLRDRYDKLRTHYLEKVESMHYNYQMKIEKLEQTIYDLKKGK